jgi:hypothetical protein
MKITAYEVIIVVAVIFGLVAIVALCSGAGFTGKLWGLIMRVKPAEKPPAASLGKDSKFKRVSVGGGVYAVRGATPSGDVSMLDGATMTDVSVQNDIAAVDNTAQSPDGPHPAAPGAAIPTQTGRQHPAHADGTGRR